ncbi:response regulator [Enterovibrio sp. ZSDZ42]|uniref:histidine kinase n=1 Tax=Enterovibrio gelatinilyticus TaxID=2899819 RepID=A0ABT5QUF8_9GAMM|nr:response regulator [Enterovibrio sp. ZSDZ42]MDD1791638.1 response regulator [Enterovibrio sp. ZSDZ42]
MTEPKSKAATIAIVDDSAPLCEMLCDLLADEGYDTQAYTSGADALVGIAESLPDLVLLDIDMPNMDGFEVCEKLKASPASQAIPVLFISSYSELDEKLKAFSCGAMDYVTKPIHLAEVTARIKTHLSLRYYQQELQAQNDILASTLKQLKDAQKQLVQSEKLASLGQIVAGVAHEINNPISFIVGNGHVLQRNIDRINQYLDCVHEQPLNEEIIEQRQSLKVDTASSDLKPAINDILEAAGRVSAIVEDLSLFSAQQQTETTLVNLSSVVSLAVKWVSASRQCMNIITLEIDENATALGHKGQLVQVIVNVLNNALDASKCRTKPKVIIQCGANNNTGWISVTDNGTGIDEGHLNQIFDPFFTTKKVGEGSGLGLAISYRLIAEQHGTLTAFNHPDGGASFCVSLPLSH